MSDPNEIVAKIRPESVVLDIAGMERDVAHEDFVREYLKIIGKQQAEQSYSLALPSNVMLMSKSASLLKLTCYYQGGPRSITHIYKDKTSKFDIIAPNIIITHHLTLDAGKNEYVTERDSLYFCTDLPASKLPMDPIISVDTKKRIFKLPFSNMYAEDRMCYGENAVTRRFPVNNLRALDWNYALLWKTPFNNDLGVKAIGDKMLVTEWYSYLQTCAKDGKPFPYEHVLGFTPNESAF